MIKIIVFLAVISIVNGSGSPNGKQYLKSLSREEIGLIPSAIVEDSLLNCPQLIEKYGYPVEIHEVETEDGYLLTMHRIPDGKLNTGSHKRGNKIPVLLMHGLLSSSVDWIVNGPEKAIGYMLADEGYDVWIGNARGNYYSKKHVTLDTKDPQFWQFSWNEIGYYDLPAMINYVLKTTEHDKLHYIGHSQGTTSFFVMGSERPEMNDKILSMHAMGPVAYMSHAETPVLTKFAPHIDEVEIIFELLGIYEMLPYTPLMAYISHFFCDEDSKYSPACLNFLFIMCGYNPAQMNTTMLPVYVSHAPAGASTKQLIHYGQEYISEKFRKYDHGPEKNLELYGSEAPPDYDLSKIVSPVALHYSDNDLFVHPLDVDRLHSELGNSLGKFRVPMDEFNHVDYIWGIDAKTLVYERVLDLMEALNP